MAAKKVRKLFQVAKELNLATSTLTEELESQEFEVTKKQMTPIPDDIYEGLLRKFAPDRWAEMQEEISRHESEEKERQAQAQRNADLQEILKSKEEETVSAPAKPTPSVRHLEPGEVIIPPIEPEIAEVDRVEIEEKKPKKKAKKVPKPTVRETPKDHKIPEISIEEVAESAVEPEKTAVKENGTTVRGAVSNDDIIAYKPQKPVEKKEKAAPKPDKAPVAEKPAEEEKPEKRKRKRKRKPQKAEEQMEGVQKKAGGWVSTGEAAGGKRKRKRSKKKKVDIKEVQATIKQTMAAMDDHGGKKKKRRRVEADVGIIDEDSNLIKITEFVSTTDLAQLIDVPVTDLIKECLMLGLRVTINQRLDSDTIQLLAEEHGYKVEFIDQVAEEEIEEEEVEETGELIDRPPVVTIMGHVDHGKTSLLDHLRKSQIVDGEAGGITQHIGAYEISHNDRKITFLDTPGHEAFTAMRARGAQVTDVVVLIVAADDQVMPQTVEAIDHAKAAGVPVVVAINKMDKEGAEPEKVKRQLADKNLVVEEYGGDIQCAEISAKKGTGIPDLLDNILIAAEMLELKAVADTTAKGVIIESRLDKGRGTICTVLVQKGTLNVGEVFVAGPYFGRVRAMFDEQGRKREDARPGQPVEITGLEAAPHVGDPFVVYKDEREAKDIATKRQLQMREQEMRLREGYGKMDLLTMDDQDHRELRLIIKGDVDGSVEAIADSLMRLSTKEVDVKIISRNVGPINESDVLLASTSNAMIIGFNIHPNLKAREMAQAEGVTIQAYRVIYELIEEVKDIIKGLHRRKFEEQIVGTAEIRDLFKISRIGVIAGCYVVNGRIDRNNKVRVLRDGQSIFEGDIETLRRFKDDAKEVKEGFECGIKVYNFNDVKVGDFIEAIEMVEVEREIEMEEI